MDTCAILVVTRDVTPTIYNEEVKMTRKDYVAIAAAICLMGSHETRQAMVDVLIPVFREDNPNFDSVRFRAAANG